MRIFQNSTFLIFLQALLLLLSSVDVDAVYTVSQQVEVPAMAKKAGGRRHYQIEEGNTDFSTSSSAEIFDPLDSSSKENTKDDVMYQYVYEDDYIELQSGCEDGEFFHVHGQKCVPLICPDYTRREPNTGDCESIFIYGGRIGRPAYRGFGRSSWLNKQYSQNRLPMGWRGKKGR